VDGQPGPGVSEIAGEHDGKRAFTVVTLLGGGESSALPRSAGLVIRVSSHSRWPRNVGEAQVIAFVEQFLTYLDPQGRTSLPWADCSRGPWFATAVWGATGCRDPPAGQYRRQDPHIMRLSARHP